MGSVWPPVGQSAEIERVLIIQIIMEGTKLTYSLVVLACFAAFIPTLNAQEHDDDAYWKERSLIAYNNTLSAYMPQPHLVTSHTNEAVYRSFSTYIL